MSSPSEPVAAASRRDFLKTTGTAVGVSALAGVKLPHVHAAVSDTLSVALIGAGGRGTGAASNALHTKSGPIKLTAMADVFANKLNNSFNGLKREHGDKVEVNDDRKFLGFDAYKQAMDCLKPGDIAILTTPPAFRWVQFAYAIEKGLNVFMEKPVTVDGPSTRRILELNKQAVAKNLKVGVGLMVRHCLARQELWKRIQDGEIGDVIFMRAYRMHGPVGSAFTRAKPPGENELLYQIRNFHSFLWASGGLYSDFYIHQVDECCWMKNAWPVRAHAIGGRHFRGDFVDQNFDNYSVEYIFEDGARFQMNGRTMNGCHDDFSSIAHGSKGLGIISTAGHSPGRCRTFKGQNISRENLLWSAEQPEKNPYQLEWDNLVDAIRFDKKHNEVERGAIASLVTSMGRMAAHTGQVIEYDQILNSEHEFAPGLDKLTDGSPAPLLADAQGRYPVPQPGILKDREF